MMILSNCDFMKVAVIGGVAAGMAMASRLKRNMHEQVEINVYEKGSHVSYGACGFPFYIKGHFDEADKLIARSAKQFEENGIHVFLHHEVTKVDPVNKKLIVSHQEGEFETSYDCLVIASGASVNTFPPFNQAYENLLSLRDLNDAIHIKEYLKKESVENVAIIGGGFIGLEMAEAVLAHNKKVILIEAQDHILKAMDHEISDVLLEELQAHHVKVLLDSKVSSLIGKERIEKIMINETIVSDVDLVINCAGIKPNTAFIDGIEKGGNGAILVNERMETSIKDVYAAGDCSMMKAYLTNEYQYSPLGTNANKQGKLIADVIAGKDIKPFKLLGSMAIRLFNKDAAKCGLSEAEAKKAGIDYQVSIITGNDTASYYSDDQMLIKLIADRKTHQILGAQAVGNGNVSARINYFAIAIANKMTSEEFAYLDLNYSPPFSGVWDVSLIAASTIK